MVFMASWSKERTFDMECRFSQSARSIGIPILRMACYAGRMRPCIGLETSQLSLTLLSLLRLGANFTLPNGQSESSTSGYAASDNTQTVYVVD